MLLTFYSKNWFYTEFKRPSPTRTIHVCRCISYKFLAICQKSFIEVIIVVVATFATIAPSIGVSIIAAAVIVGFVGIACLNVSNDYSY